MSRTKRAGYEHANLSADCRALFAQAELVFADLGTVQRPALISCDPNSPLVAVMRTETQAYPLTVRASLQRRGLLAAGECWELTPLGALVRQAGGTHDGTLHGTRGT